MGRGSAPAVPQRRIQPLAFRQHVPADFGVAQPIHPLPLLPALVAADVADQQIEVVDLVPDRGQRLGFYP